MSQSSSAGQVAVGVRSLCSTRNGVDDAELPDLSKGPFRLPLTFHPPHHPGPPARAAGGPASRGRRADGESTESARQPDSVRAWTRSATRTRPAQDSGRPSSPAATPSCGPSTSCWSGLRGGGRSAASCSPGCVGSARPCCSTRCARPPYDAAGAPASSRPDPTRGYDARCPRRSTRRCASSGTPTRSRSPTCSAWSAPSPSARPAPGRSSATSGTPASTPRLSAAGPTPATSRSTSSSSSPTSAASRRTVAWGSRSSSTRCRTSVRTTSPPSARPATRSASRGCR